MSNQPRIALMGVYAGLFREYNPGCVLILKKALHELGKRMNASFQPFSLDSMSEHSGVETEEIHGHAIRIFSRNPASLAKVEQELLGYDGIMIGGDVLWGGPIAWGAADVKYDSRALFLHIFLLNAFPAVLAAKMPVAYNCVHSYPLSDGSRPLSDHERSMFIAACQRASYIAVRTEHIRSQLNKLGQEHIQCVPDPVLDLEWENLGTWEIEPRMTAVFRELQGARKKTLGISVAPSRARYLIQALKQIDISDFDVWVYPFSRYYNNMESVYLFKAAFGSRCRYIEHYIDAFDVCKLVGTFDVNVNDTMHGTVAALALGKSGITMEHDKLSAPGATKMEPTLKYAGLERGMIRLPFNIPELEVSDAEYTENVGHVTAELKAMLERQPRADMATLAVTKKRIQQHFDEMAAALQRKA